MLRLLSHRLLIMASALLLLATAPPPEEWGFFGHRRLNRLAVFTLPPQMIPYYKNHIEYITEHAVDPDKRRYATRHEAVRHYIDIDHWGTYPFPEVPRDWGEALMTYAEFSLVYPSGDTLIVASPDDVNYSQQVVQYKGSDQRVRRLWEEANLPVNTWLTFFRKEILPQYYQDTWTVSCDTLSQILGISLNCVEVRIRDGFSEYGILPYNLLQVQERLTNAFRSGNEAAILRLSAEIGHYIGDGHVPLHTTVNYNGELTNQRGIHAFWESRIPELFADAEFDNFVGPAEYISDPASFYWEVVLTSHQLVDSVLAIEKELSLTYPQDQQYCYEERLGRTIRVECTEYARAYKERMRGMVEERWRATIHTIGSAWYTAWIDAGKPNLALLGEGLTPDETDYFKSLEEAYRSGEAKGRQHSGR
mgnify:FL=1